MNFLEKHPLLFPCISLAFALLSLGFSTYNIGFRRGHESCEATTSTAEQP